jgi:hypothetical protein
MEVQQIERGSRRLFPQTFTIGVLAVVLVVAAMMATSPSEAATGSNLTTFDATVTAGIPPCSSSVGTGNAFDGVRLYLSCTGSNVLERVVASTHLSAGPITVSGMTSIDAMAYDATLGGGKIWACHNFSDVYLIALSPVPPALPTTAVGTFQFSTSNGCRDGLAFDGVGTPSIWASGDASDSIQHYTLAGGSIGSFSGLTAKLGGSGNSGIAVGGTALYLANDGGSQIYQCDKGLVTCTLMSTFPARIEDLECDDITFAPKSAIWSQDAFDRIQNAWEIPAGSCGVGGVAPTPVSPVGGLVALPVSDSGSAPWIQLSVAAAAALAMLAVGVWYGRRRMLG